MNVLITTWFSMITSRTFSTKPKLAVCGCSGCVAGTVPVETGRADGHGLEEVADGTAAGIAAGVGI
jgi:hypothetical protein